MSDGIFLDKKRDRSAMEHRVTANELRQTLASWDALFPGRWKIRLVACCGTALSLLGYTESTKDVDFLVPNEKEYERLLKFLIRAGYERVTGEGWRRSGEVIQYDLYPGKRVFQTELINSPLEANGHKKIWEGKKIYLGVLNSADLIITKLFRGMEQDVEDCLALLDHEAISLQALEERYRETARYEISEERVIKNLEHFLTKVRGMKK